MDASEVSQILGLAATVSDKIRMLDGAGYPRAEIARLLGKRYQHVRNVLEGDKAQGRPGVRPPSAGRSQGVREGASAFDGVVRLDVQADGAVRLPQAILTALGSGTGGVLIAELRPEGLMVLNRDANWSKLDELMRPFRDPQGSVVDELIAERRAEAASEDGRG